MSSSPSYTTSAKMPLHLPIKSLLAMTLVVCARGSLRGNTPTAPHTPTNDYVTVEEGVWQPIGLGHERDYQTTNDLRILKKQKKNHTQQPTTETVVDEGSEDGNDDDYYVDDDEDDYYKQDDGKNDDDDATTYDTKVSGDDDNNKDADDSEDDYYVQENASTDVGETNESKEPILEVNTSITSETATIAPTTDEPTSASNQEESVGISDDDFGEDETSTSRMTDDTEATTGVEISSTTAPTNVQSTSKPTPSPTVPSTKAPTTSPTTISTTAKPTSTAKVSIATSQPTETAKTQNTVISTPSVTKKEMEEQHLPQDESIVDVTPPQNYYEETEELNEQIKHEEFIAEERAVEKIGGWAILICLCLMMFTAHQMSENPDGVFANICRLSITVTGCVFKILLFPCKKICGQRYGGYAHHLVTTQDSFGSPYGGSNSNRLDML